MLKVSEIGIRKNIELVLSATKDAARTFGGGGRNVGRKSKN